LRTGERLNLGVLPSFVHHGVCFAGKNFLAEWARELPAHTERNFSSRAFTSHHENRQAKTSLQRCGWTTDGNWETIVEGSNQSFGSWISFAPVIVPLLPINMRSLTVHLNVLIAKLLEMTKPTWFRYKSYRRLNGLKASMTSINGLNTIRSKLRITKRDPLLQSWPHRKNSVFVSAKNHTKSKSYLSCAKVRHQSATKLESTRVNSASQYTDEKRCLTESACCENTKSNMRKTATTQENTFPVSVKVH